MKIDVLCCECQRLQSHDYLLRSPCYKCARDDGAVPDYTGGSSLQRLQRFPNGYEQPFSTTQLNINLNRMSVSSQINSETVTYFNLYMASDFAPTSNEDFRLTDCILQEFGKISKTLLTCVVATHKTIRGLGNNDVLMFEHQGMAARELNSLIQQTQQVPLYRQIIDAMTMFIGVQIQQSVYGPWRIHLDGAKSILNSCPESLLACNEEDVHFLAILDVYGTTTTPPKLLSPEMVAHHTLYRRMLAHFNVDPLQTPTPIPNEILDATIAINIYRIEHHTGHRHSRDQQSSLDAIISSLEEFDPQKWAAGLAAEYLPNSKSLAILATCYSSATLLYLLQSCRIHSTSKYVRWKSGVRRQTAYRDLKNAVTTLFRDRLRNGTYHKTIFWPIVICGIEAAAQGSRVDFLCEYLEIITMELGANGMREAAAFLKGLVEMRQQRGVPHGEMFEFDWNEIFALAPIFIM
ncbi:hypothetical protein DE146DRAFT_753589 [Phaeosphaeria sp. MPI-PUGE-AT-0046c]|nr:hypothetical protein DE146DRAFT_753589 [Phaeosphaeria sp. MPI-PUGE-AT-0046c]